MGTTNSTEEISVPEILISKDSTVMVLEGSNTNKSTGRDDINPLNIKSLATVICNNTREQIGAILNLGVL